jgi:taurine--2-oxoglutarate transaminase
VYFFDSEGKPYLDFSPQMKCSNLGHKNPVVIEAIQKQAEKLTYIASVMTFKATFDAIEAQHTVVHEGEEILLFHFGHGGQ